MDLPEKIKAIELAKPHGFLVWKGKQTCLIDKEILPADELIAIVSDNEVYGLAQLENAVEVTEEFLKEDKTHRLKSYEIPDGQLYAHNIKKFNALEKPMSAHIENGLLVLEEIPELNKECIQLLEQAKELPNSITIEKNMVSIDEKGNVIGADDSMIEMLNKNFDKEFKESTSFTNPVCGIYDLTLTRVPNMRFKQMEPPNLRMADSESINCKMCEYWNNGTCELYKYMTDANQVCDSFDPRYEGTAIMLPVPIEVGQYLMLREQDVPMGSKLSMPEDMHITLYYEKNIDPLNLLDMPQLLEYIGEEIQPPVVNINGIAKFEMVENGEYDALVVGVTSPEIEKVHNWICSYLGIDYEEKRFTPHITVAYVPTGSQIPNVNYNRETFSIPSIALHAGGTRMFETRFRGSHMYDEDKDDGKKNPYEMYESNGQYCVRKIGETEAMECYDNEQEAQDYLVALEIATQNEGKELSEIKEGRRLKRQWLKKLSDFGQVIQEMLSWAKYEDEDKMVGFEIKEVNGEPYFFTYSTNAFEDRDEEIIATQALEEYVLRNEENEVKGYFNMWHVPYSDFAEKHWQAVIGRILVEAGPFLKNKKGRRALKFFNKHPKGHPIFAPEGWGASIEFKYLPEQRPSGVYNWLHITRTSVLPLSRAANINTKGELKMTPEQKELGKEMFGEDVMEQIEQQAEGVTKQLEKTTRYKEVEKENDEDTEVTSEDVEEEKDEQEEVVTENSEQEEVTESKPEPEEEPEGEEEEQVEEQDVETEPELQAEVPEPGEVENIVEQVAERVSEGLKEDLDVIKQVVSTFPDVMQQLGNRISQLEDKAKVEKAVKPRSWGLFAQGFANSVTQVEGDEKGKEATEEEIEKASPPETKPNEKEEGYGGVFFNR